MVKSQTTLHLTCCTTTRLVASHSDFIHAPHVRINAAKKRPSCETLLTGCRGNPFGRSTMNRCPHGNDIPSNLQRTYQHNVRKKLVDQALD